LDSLSASIDISRPGRLPSTAAELSGVCVKQVVPVGDGVKKGGAMITGFAVAYHNVKNFKKAKQWYL